METINVLAEVKSRYANRTVESISLEVLEACSDSMAIVGGAAAELPRQMILLREYEGNVVFADAVKLISETILTLFPNDPTADSTNQSS